MTEYLTLDDITALGVPLLAREGQEFLIGDAGLLQSALARPQMTVFGDDAYPSLHSKAAALLESIARNHALIDGNKRLAWSATVVFLYMNGVNLQAPDVDRGERFVLAVAAGQVDLNEIATKIALWSTPVG